MRTNSATRGSWAGAYGADGYALAQGASSVPAYAQVGVAGHLNYTWAASTPDSRALQKPGAADRLAACWYGKSSFAVTLNLTGGQAFAADDPTALREVFRRIDSMKPARVKPSTPEPADYFGPFAIAGLSFAGLHLLSLLGLRFTPW